MHSMQIKILKIYFRVGHRHYCLGVIPIQEKGRILLDQKVQALPHLVGTSKWEVEAKDLRVFL